MTYPRDLLVAKLFARALLGGADVHDTALQEDMHTTLTRLKDYVEQL